MSSVISCLSCFASVTVHVDAKLASFRRRWPFIAKEGVVFLLALLTSVFRMTISHRMLVETIKADGPLLQSL